MERLTKYSNDLIRNKAVNILRKLDSENGLDCDELALISSFCLIERVENKQLKKYEDLEEQGKLLKLPCSVGDKIYRIDTDEKIENREIEFYDIDNIVILSDGTVLLKYDTYDGVICELENIVSDKPYLDFYRCFLTQQEAEQALAEMEGKNGN